MKKARIAVVCIAWGLAGSAHAEGQPAVSEPTPGCGTFQYEREHVGPLDYRTIHPKVLKLVQDYHFTRQVETLRRGQSGSIGGDLAYTLNAIPNHPRALRSMIDFFQRNPTRARLETRMMLDCWIDRAISYRPDDPMTRILIAEQRIRERKRDEAVEHLRVAEQYAGDSATVHYNLGLLYLDLKDFDRSVQHAQKAYALGAPLPGLKNMLAESGKWRE